MSTNHESKSLLDNWSSLPLDEFGEREIDENFIDQMYSALTSGNLQSIIDTLSQNSGEVHHFIEINHCATELFYYEPLKIKGTDSQHDCYWLGVVWQNSNNDFAKFNQSEFRLEMANQIKDWTNKIASKSCPQNTITRCELLPHLFCPGEWEELKIDIKSQWLKEFSTSNQLELAVIGKDLPGQSNLSSALPPIRMLVAAIEYVQLDRSHRVFLWSKLALSKYRPAERECWMGNHVESWDSFSPPTIINDASMICLTLYLNKWLAKTHDVFDITPGGMELKYDFSKKSLKIYFLDSQTTMWLPVPVKWCFVEGLDSLKCLSKTGKLLQAQDMDVDATNAVGAGRLH